jgi:hypothetical protein
MVVVAQLVERRVVVSAVAGSNPVNHPLTKAAEAALGDPSKEGVKVFRISFAFYWISLDICADIYYNGVNKSTCS